jgi:hypothetical protein
VVQLAAVAPNISNASAAARQVAWLCAQVDAPMAGLRCGAASSDSMQCGQRAAPSLTRTQVYSYVNSAEAIAVLPGSHRPLIVAIKTILTMQVRVRVMPTG